MEDVVLQSLKAKGAKHGCDFFQYWDQPDYVTIYSLVDQACRANEFNDSDPYDWEKPAGGGW